MSKQKASEQTWPEMAAVDKWIEKNGIEVSQRDALELSVAVSKHRLSIETLKCLRDKDDCIALSQIKSDCGGSFICCGQNNPESRHYPQDEFRHCTHSEHYDDMVQCDTRDLVDTIHVLSGALHIKESKIAVARIMQENVNKDIHCPVCGYYCLGKGGAGCIDKPTLCGLEPPQENDL